MLLCWTNFDGGKYSEFGGLPGRDDRIALTVLGMGDRNAVDLCQVVHGYILRNKGTFHESNVIRYSGSLPNSSVWQGLYIDDHLSLEVIDRSALTSGEPLQSEVQHDKAVQACLEAGLEISNDKCFRRQSSPHGALQLIAELGQLE